jgi:hypothetical protein
VISFIVNLSQANAGDERKVLEVNDEIYFWDEIVHRSHIILRSTNWNCLYDTKLKLRYFQKKETGECQLQKPSDFDSNIEVRHFFLLTAQNFVVLVVISCSSCLSYSISAKEI